MSSLEVKKLGEVCDFVRGPFGGSLKKSCFVESGYAVYEQQHAIYNQFTNIRYFVDETKFNEMKRFELSSGDLIMSCSGTMGKVAIVPAKIQKGIINQALLKLTTHPQLDVYYLKYWMESPNFQHSINENSKGVAIKNVASVKVLKQIPIYLPSFQEQQRIVQKLDTAFKAIDKAIANTERNLLNTKDLFQSKLNGIFTQHEKDWDEKRLGEITTKIGSGATPRGGQASYKESGISLIRSLNVYDNGFKPAKLAFIDDEQADKLKNVTLQKNDVLLNITGASVARCCVVPESYLPARVNQHVSIIRLENNLMRSRFLHYALISKENKDKLLGIGEQGATRQAITKSQIQNFSVQFPKELTKQDHIINELDLIKKHSLNFEKNYQTQLQNLHDLKKSILSKAFSGEL